MRSFVTECFIAVAVFLWFVFLWIVASTAVFYISLFPIPAHADSADCAPTAVWYGCLARPVNTVWCDSAEQAKALVDDISVNGGTTATLKFLPRYSKCYWSPVVRTVIGKLVYERKPFIVIKSLIKPIPYVIYKSAYVGHP